jgi:HTH-type transcriptional repressor of NAD biosynthesis genes
MSPKARTGMLLGKFLPPHYGHVYLGDFAKNFVEDLTIVVGTLPAEPIPGELRFEWMRSLFPGVRVLHLNEILPQEPSEHPDFWNIWRDVLKRILPCPPDVVFASETYGIKLAEVLGARFVPVDPSRHIRPVSGTAVRNDPFGNWELIPPPVRAWYVRRVCIFGPESTGKSTLTHRLAEHFQTVAVPEYARTLLELKGGRLEEPDLLDIARGQIASEDALAPYANKILFTDTDVLTTVLWSNFLYHRTDEWIRAEAERRTYALYLLTDVDVPWVEDQVRYLPTERNSFLKQCQDALESRGRAYLKLSGSWDERFQRAVEACSKLLI